MIKHALHRIAAHPWVYDRIQTLAGNRQILDLLSRNALPLNPKSVVDIGGGTGTVRQRLATDCRYLCLDLEMPKLEGFKAKAPNGLAVCGDATHMPIRDGCAELLICKSVTHHLTDAQLDKVLDESQRVLQPGGHIVLLDAVVNLRRFASRMLWKLDRGSHPRRAEDLRQKLEARFVVEHWEKYAVYHEYVLGIGVKR